MKTKNNMKHYTFRYSVISDGHDIDEPTDILDDIWSKVEAKNYEDAVEKLEYHIATKFGENDGRSYHAVDIEPFRITSKKRTRIPTLKGIKIIK